MTAATRVVQRAPWELTTWREGVAGTGLSIAAAVASAHGGRAGAANRAGGGADVWIALPVAPLS